jgi:hypothetical protein
VGDAQFFGRRGEIQMAGGSIEDAQCVKRREASHDILGVRKTNSYYQE